MERWYQCTNCGSLVFAANNFCTICGESLHWLQQESQSNLDEPSMHLMPLDRYTKEPVVYRSERGKYLLPAVTTNGRLSWLTGTKDVVKAIRSRIEDRYPKQFYDAVQSYVSVGVVIKPLNKMEAVLIHEVWGFWEHIKELDDLYNTLCSLAEVTVGSVHWNQVEQYLANDTVKTWINALIDFLRQQLQWKDYVFREIDKFSR